MGQCPTTPPSHEEEQPWVGNGAESASASLDSAENQFLTCHTFDSPASCIINPISVHHALEYQNNIMISQRITETANGMVGADIHDGEMTDVAMNNSIADTDVTGVSLKASEAPTDCTSKMNNLTRYAPKASSSSLARKKPKAKRRQFGISSIDEEDDWAEPQSLDPPQSSGSPQLGSSHPPIPEGTSNGLNAQHIPFHDSTQDRTRPIHGVCFSPIVLTGCLNDTSITRQSLPANKSSVLHLKMRPHMVDFYLDKFLVMFPNSPHPKGLSKNRSAVWKRPSKVGWKEDTLHPSDLSNPPTLVHSTSNSSSSSSRSVSSTGSVFRPNAVLMAIDNSSFLDCAFTGSLGLIDRTPPQSQRLPHQTGSRHKNPNHYLVLLNQQTGQPLAVCALKSLRGPPVVRIYATKPRVRGQKPATSTGDVGLAQDPSTSLPLYAWAEFVTEGEFPLPVNYFIYMSTGFEGKFEKEPSFCGSHAAPGSPEIMVVGRTAQETTYTGCCFLSFRSSKMKTYFALSISLGVDPALFMCLAAIVDETMEDTMRKQYNFYAKKVLKKIKQKQKDASDFRKVVNSFERQQYKVPL